MWALCDGVVPTENMQQCYAATTQINQFWKYWHSSFYLWNKRYLYIPLGGSKRSMCFGWKYFNILAVFAFTALWHGDFGLSLLIWGSLMGIGIIPELVLSNWYWTTELSAIVFLRNNSYLNRYVHAFFGGVNDIILISANMIGYGPGFNVMVDIWKTLLSTTAGWKVLMWGVSWTTIGNIMIIHMKYLKQKETFAAISIASKRSRDSKQDSKNK